ncbi:putative molluscan insulin-related peptide(s) receptor [Gigantopelta aegis]|uniref:putative molluscan insulin-related peptide(s) receptor n=1 Tax=Gigantopelta aegis TaxID=1735272 RepID=UPI001B88C782|nr:putative molluscan insulin-related peptide(s) receptor [Gigantopelta aegis]
MLGVKDTWRCILAMWILAFGLQPDGISRSNFVYSAVPEARASNVTKTDGVCGDIDIRNEVTNFKQLEDCVVIEGKLHIQLIANTDERDFDKYSFPKLVEITGHLFLYRVYGLKTLRNLFPNLAVIRGQELFYNYALVAYEMPDMETLGLQSLTTIMRGAVRMEKNNKLCYIETIDWSRVAIGVPVGAHDMKDNKEQQETCVNVCPESCPSTNGKSYCWTAEICQKNLDCPNTCAQPGFKTGYCQIGTRTCCHKSCVGGCTGPHADDCISCTNVTYKGKCEPRCPRDTYVVLNRRCLLDKECLNFSRKSLLIHWEDNSPGRCVEECPHGYTIDEKQRVCLKCKGYCPKECEGKVVDSIQSANDLKGCTKIKGPLEINIMGGSNIGMELEKSLGQIKEVSQYIKVVRSYALLSFDFFKSLEIIKGDELEHDTYALYVMDNGNLQDLFTDKVSKNLRIKKGKVWFQHNRKLCFNKIESFLKGINVTYDKTDVSRDNNGDQIPCSVRQIRLEVTKMQYDIVILEWTKFQAIDKRQLLSYVINFREVKQNETVNIYQGRDACSKTIWKTRDEKPERDDLDHMTAMLTNLKAWTKYAVYIETYTTSMSKEAAISKILYFTTDPYYPSSPSNLEVLTEVDHELHVKWEPPIHPNGNVTHYIVYWQLQAFDPRPFDQRDYCKNPIHLQPKKKKKESKVNRYTNMTETPDSKCCSCPRSAVELENLERNRQSEIDFQNYLLDSTYLKKPRGSEDDDRSRRRDRLKRYAVTGTTMIEDNTPAVNNTDANSTEAVTENMFYEAVVYGEELIIPGLGHFQEYNIEVLACQETNPKSGEKFCSSRAIATARTRPSKAADNINASTVKISEVSNHTGQIMIKWESPKNPNGLIVTFEIEYWKTNLVDHNPLRLCFPHKKYRSLSGYKLVKLEPGNYTFKIRATSLAGNGSWTSEFTFFIESPSVSQMMSKTVIAIIVISVLVVIIITIIVVWFVAKSKFAKDPNDMTTSTNPGYMPSLDVYIPDEWEFDRDKIKLIRELGQGSFGMVYEGIAKDLDGKGEIRVAVKTVNNDAGFHERTNFLKEAGIMKQFSCHHVVKLLGVVSKGQPALVIMELMIKGDLKNYLRQHRPDEEDNNGQQPPTLQEIWQMSGEIADGMAYLSDKKFVHRDLAARNCMVSENLVVKIGDFGMTRDIYETDYYRKGGKGLLPVRWMAPESLKDGMFTTMSDVWSYGVVLWEMSTLAAQPYQGLSNEEVLKYVNDGRIMEKPEGCPDKLYEMMLKCWRFRYKQRPTFKEIIEELVPDLNTSFKDVSYFFSDENKTEGAEFEQLGNKHLDLDDIDNDSDQREYNLDINDEVRIPFMSAVDPDVSNIESQRSPNRNAQRPNTGTNPCECVLLEEMANGNRDRSSPVSATGQTSSEGGSKESSKSSNSSYTRINGMANGHVHMRLPRTTQC